MSIRLMTAVWATTDLTSGKKLVALALADCADDDGRCWPSVGHLANKCSMSERAIQGHLAALTKDGILKRKERLGRSAIYILDPRRICTPAESAPPQNLHLTPAESAPTPAESAPRTTNTRQRSQKTTTPLPPAHGAGGGEDEEYVRLAADDYCRIKNLGPERLPGTVRRIRERLVCQGGMTELDHQQHAAFRRREQDAQAMRARQDAQAMRETPLTTRLPTDEPPVWRQARQHLQTSLSSSIYSVWIAPLVCLSQKGNTLELAGPDPYFCSWIKNNYLEDIQDSLKNAGLVGAKVRLTVAVADAVEMR